MSPTKTPRFARAIAPFLVATALVSIPALAQDAAPQTAQPVVTPPNSATVTIPPVVRTVPDAATTDAATTTATDQAAAPTARSATRTVTRSTASRTATRAAPVRASTTATRTASAPATAPAATPPEPTTAPASSTTTTTTQPASASAPAASDAAPTTTQTSATTTGGTVPAWAWIAGAIAVLAIILGAAVAMRRRRIADDEYAEPAYVEEPYVEPAPVATAPVAEPVAAVPVVAPRKEPEYLKRSAQPAGAVEPAVATAEDVDVSSAPADEVAELTSAAAPVAERPWLEFAMRPVRAGTNVDEALVEIELTVGNAGTLPAQDVRISTFLLSGDVAESEMERLLVDAPADATTDPVTIQPGEGKRIDATLALLKTDLGERLPEAFRPIVVADARYTLADGSEGRTSASFTIGVTPEEGEGLAPIELSRAAMHDNVAAELHGEPQHA